MELFSTLGSLTFLLIGAFYLRKLWLGATMALVFLIGFKLYSGENLAGFSIPGINGAVISIELALLLFGAYLLFKVLQANDHFRTLNQITSAFSSKLTVIILFTYFLGSFMEGVAGFGIPAMLITPMLLTLGFRPQTCIIIPLAANTTAVTFGALGTPLKIGLGIMEPDAVVQFTVLLNFIPAVLLPFFLAFLFEKTEKTNINWQENWKMLLGAGVIYAVLYLSTGLFTIEYASVISGILGLLLFTFFFVPKKENPPLQSWFDTFYPYLIFIVLLLISKFFLADLAWSITEDSRAISLYQPGAIFILAAWVYLLYIKGQAGGSFFFSHHLKHTGQIVSKTVLTLFVLVSYAQFIRGDIAQLTQTHLSDLGEHTKLFVSPVLGVLGSFLSGSATMSNLIFGNTIQSAAFAVSNAFLFSALLNTGSAIGNCISLQNILMVKSVINAPEVNYSTIMKLNLLLIALYLLIVIGISFLIFASGQTATQ
ncbi:L-lactate permease [Algoriphagus hitonicola]|uniref:L-lactate permease n=1 Tax=Algoriphagus hitonicola TaxID=435880 RepID=A0A1I2PG39_9BACT|nr:L-lactate permease [Algoriphagus hitonicola]SFG14099.1 L-lactate permease [Algoriphagus hitonicola]